MYLILTSLHRPGAILRDVQQPGKNPHMSGSVMIARTASREELMQELRQDIYCTSGVWNLDEAQIHPVRIIIRHLCTPKR